MTLPRLDRTLRRNRWREINSKIERIRKEREAQADVYRIDTEVLTIEGVARLLRCSVDHVRSLSVSELPRATGLGRRHQYLRSDVIELVRRRRTHGDLNSRSFDDLLNSEAENVRRHSP